MKKYQNESVTVTYNMDGSGFMETTMDFSDGTIIECQGDYYPGDYWTAWITVKTPLGDVVFEEHYLDMCSDMVDDVISDIVSLCDIDDDYELTVAKAIMESIYDDFNEGKSIAKILKEME